jgi:hypothetical protein
MGEPAHSADHTADHGADHTAGHGADHRADVQPGSGSGSKELPMVVADRSVPASSGAGARREGRP